MHKAQDAMRIQDSRCTQSVKSSTHSPWPPEALLQDIDFNFIVIGFSWSHADSWSALHYFD